LEAQSGLSNQPLNTLGFVGAREHILNDSCQSESWEVAPGGITQRFRAGCWVLNADCCFPTAI